MARRGQRIGYLQGAGDDIPGILGQLGYSIRNLSEADFADGDLGQLDAIVLGVRAFNTRPRLAAASQRLFDYVAAGGTLVVQYNTAHRLVTEELGPYPLELSRHRVSVEEAPVRLLQPEG